MCYFGQYRILMSSNTSPKRIICIQPLLWWELGAYRAVEPVFCAGADLNSWINKKQEEGLKRVQLHNTGSSHSCPKPCPASSYIIQYIVGSSTSKSYQVVMAQRSCDRVLFVGVVGGRRGHTVYPQEKEQETGEVTLCTHRRRSRRQERSHCVATTQAQRAPYILFRSFWQKSCKKTIIFRLDDRNQIIDIRQRPFL